MKRIIPLILLLLVASAPMQAQKNNARARYEAFKKHAHKEYESFRQKCMKEYLEFVRQPWEDKDEDEPMPMPKEDPVPPIVLPEKDREKPIETKPVIVEEVIVPAPVAPQPQPIEPIKEVPTVEEKTFTFTFFGTPAKVRFDAANKVRLRGFKGKDIADALQEMATEAYENLIVDCLALRKKHALSDWAYLQMLKAMAETVYGAGTSESELLVAYVYMQSGYKMRFATDDSHLYMLFASKHYIYNMAVYEIEGEKYYGLNPLPERMHICPATYPKEQSMSLYNSSTPVLSMDLSQPRRVASKHYPDVVATMQINQNLMDFYCTYPTSKLGEDVCSRWAMYANTPMDEQVQNTLYPQLKRAISGKSQLEAANILLNWIQTGMEYEYDDEVWGGDRAFFAEETLFYPSCDCEDRSILYTRLVRDLLGLPCILVYYPGHLASAVCFPDKVDGDYILLNNQKFTVTDPTYIGAPVGITMTGMNNKTAKVILLD